MPSSDQGNPTISALFYINIYMSRTFALAPNPNPSSPSQLDPSQYPQYSFMKSFDKNTRSNSAFASSLIKMSGGQTCQPPVANVNTRGPVPQFRQLFYYDSPPVFFPFFCFIVSPAQVTPAHLFVICRLRVCRLIVAAFCLMHFDFATAKQQRQKFVICGNRLTFTRRRTFVFN